MKTTTSNLMVAPACADSVPTTFIIVPSHMSFWVAPVQGIAMSTPATQLGGYAGIVATTVAANAAKGADRKRTAGYEAFEDPL